MSANYYYRTEFALDQICKQGQLPALVKWLLAATTQATDLHRNPDYRAVLAVLMSDRYKTHYVPATKVRIGCVKCGEIHYSESLPIAGRFGVDFLYTQCNVCAKFSDELDIAHRLLYTNFGGIMDEI